MHYSLVGALSAEQFAAWSTFATALIAAIGLFGVWLTFSSSAREQRVQWGPYVRVDIGPPDGTGDFASPAPHYRDAKGCIDLAPDASTDRKVTVSTWLRNYQAHPLGFALAASAFFILEVRKDSTGLPRSDVQYHKARLPYLEHSKAVQLDLFTFPQDWEVFVWLGTLEFHDIYQRRHAHEASAENTALHGRLSCSYARGSFTCYPQGRPRGDAVDSSTDV